MLILVRHASPRLPTLGGPDDFHRGLIARGHAEAAALAERLAESAPVRVLSSPYLRSARPGVVASGPGLSGPDPAGWASGW